MPLNDQPALLIDFGGVITESVLDAFQLACRAHGVDPAGFIAEAFAPEHSAESPFSLVELGRITLPEFTTSLTPLLERHALGPVDARGWFSDVQATTQRVDPRMTAALQELYERGVDTVLVSNSWGPRDTYPWHLMPEFSATIVSSEVGARKPDTEIYRIAVRSVGRKPEHCVFVDDVEVNLAPAHRLGMTTVLHRDPYATLATLRRIYG